MHVRYRVRGMNASPQHETFLHARQAVRLTKARMAALSMNGEADVPLLVVTFQKGQLLNAFPLGETLAEGIPTAVAAMALSDCDLVIHVDDDILIDSKGSTDRHDVSGRFHAGDPSVREALLYVAVGRDGQHEVAVDAYRYVQGRIEFDLVPAPPPLLAHTVNHELIPLYQDIYAHQELRRSRYGAPMGVGTGLVHLGTQMTSCEHMIIHEFGLIQPCPCGSRLPMRECCARLN